MRIISYILCSAALAGTDAAEAPWRKIPLQNPGSGKAGFTLMTNAVAFTNVLTDERGLTNQIYMSGSGVAAGDVDGDGWCDLYFCAIDSPNRFFRNLGNWRFEARAGIGPDQPSTGATFADVDGDGDLDLLVTGLARGARLFLNDGQGKFRETTDEAGLRSQSAAMSLALADIEGDGDLDLYVCNFRSSTLQDEVNVPFRMAITNGQTVIRSINDRPPTAEDLTRYTVSARNNIVENGEADVLLHNDGRGRFTPVSWVDGSFQDEHGKPLRSPPYDWTYTAMFRDLNGDGAPDLYTCSDNQSPDRIWINDGRGQFHALSVHALRHTSLASMGVDFADLNRDGHDDFFVVDMMAREHGLRQRLITNRRSFVPPGELDERLQYMRNTLFLNRGDGTYAEIAQLSGVEASDWSWSPIFLDVDLDGFEDLLITTGLERSLRDADARRHIDNRRARGNLPTREFQELRRIMHRLETPNAAFRNRRDLTFENQSDAWGFNSREVSSGMALADLDNDGDLDVVVNALNGPALLYRNDCPAPRIAVRLKGTGGVGAKIKALGASVTQSQEMICGGRYLSGDDAVRTFAAGKNPMRLEVTWRNGKTTILTNAEPGHVYELNEHGARDTPSPKGETPSPWFADASDLLAHQHFEQFVNDFERQFLLPRQLSQLGPGVCWADVNDDGWDDLIVGAGGGGKLGWFVNQKGKGFARIEPPGVAAEDHAGIVHFGQTLFVGSSSYENTNAPSLLQFGSTTNIFPPAESSTGPLAVGDLNADGQVEVFLGGRMVPGRYPEPASSRLFGRGLFLTFTNIGMVSGAVFSDLNNDGLPELVLACDWGPLKILRNDKGRLTPADFGLGALTGWWNSVTAGDFNNDGRMDLIAGNWGRNTKYQSYRQRPLHALYGDIDGDGTVEIVEAFEEKGKLWPWRPLDNLSRAMPWLVERFPTFAAYSVADVDQILGDDRPRMTDLTVTTLDSMLFLNQGDRFEARPLPIEAQFSPVFGLSVGDFDADGNEDLFLAQNFFGTDLETSCYDAGRGLCLRGDGRGNFSALSAPDSGIIIHGEQRACALSDFDHDGRVDLVVTQNGAATKLYTNQSAQSGIRIRLQGPAIGASLRLGNGPAREIHVGSGYWSQDSLVQILARPKSATRLTVRWPGGRLTHRDIAPDAREIEIQDR